MFRLVSAWTSPSGQEDVIQVKFEPTEQQRGIMIARSAPRRPRCSHRSMAGPGECTTGPRGRSRARCTSAQHADRGSLARSANRRHEQQAGDGLREQQRREQPDCDPGGGQADGATDDHPHHVARPGPHRHAQADLAGALGRGDRDHPVDAEAGQRQGRRAEEREQRRREPPRRERPRQERVDGRDAVEGEVRCDGPDGVLDDGDARRGVVALVRDRTPSPTVSGPIPRSSSYLLLRSSTEHHDNPHRTPQCQASSPFLQRPL